MGQSQMFSVPGHGPNGYKILSVCLDPDFLDLKNENKKYILFSCISCNDLYVGTVHMAYIYNIYIYATSAWLIHNSRLMGKSLQRKKSLICGILGLAFPTKPKK